MDDGRAFGCWVCVHHKIIFSWILMLCPVSFIVEDEGSEFFTRTFRQPSVSTRESQFLREIIYSGLRPAFPLIMIAMQYSSSIYLLNIFFSKPGSNSNLFTYNTGWPLSRQWQTGCKHAMFKYCDWSQLLISHLRNSPFNYPQFACWHPFWPSHSNSCPNRWLITAFVATTVVLMPRWSYRWAMGRHWRHGAVSTWVVPLRTLPWVDGGFGKAFNMTF